MADRLAGDPVIVAHSMGGLASLAYASKNPVKALVLITPVVPKGYADEEIPLPLDPSAMWLAPPEMLRQLFWESVDDEKSRRFESLVVPESPRLSWKRLGGQLKWT